MKIMMIKYYDQIRAWVTYIYGGSILGVTCIYIYTCYTDISTVHLFAFIIVINE